MNTPGAPGYVFPGNLVQPKENGSLGVQCGVHMPAGLLTPRLDVVYQSKETYNPLTATSAPLPQDINPSRSIYNARLTYETADSKWQGTLAVNNLTDKYYYYTMFPFSGFDSTANVAPPRTYMLSVKRVF